MKASCVAVVLLILLAPPAGAQQPGSQQYNSVLLPALGAGDTRQSARGEKRWGAIAASAPFETFGSALNMLTEDEAGQVALDRCAQAGGANCRVVITFDNLCVALAARGTRWRASSREKQKSATQDVIKDCSQPGRVCPVLFEGCSHP